MFVKHVCLRPVQDSTFNLSGPCADTEGGTGGQDPLPPPGIFKIQCKPIFFYFDIV